MTLDSNMYSKDAYLSQMMRDNLRVLDVVGYMALFYPVFEDEEEFNLGD